MTDDPRDAQLAAAEQIAKEISRIIEKGSGVSCAEQILQLAQASLLLTS